MILLSVLVGAARLTQGGVVLGPWSQPRPIEVEIVSADGTARWYAEPYAKGTEGTLTTPAGSRIRVVDRYKSLGNGFLLHRETRVLAVGAGETAFSTRFSLAAPVSLRERESLLPGVLYRRNEDVPPGSLASDLDDAAILVREDRLPLPVAMTRDPETGASVEMVHERPDGATFAGEDGRARIVDGRMRFGSIGFLQGSPSPSGSSWRGGRGERPRTLALAFQYPGSEGERTGIGGRAKAWARRNHPLRAGFTQTYDLRATLGVSRGFAEAVEGTWRRAFERADPRPPKADFGKVYRASMDLLDAMIHEYDGVPSVPFQARLPYGNVIDASSQMGFVGKALPAASLLLRDALERKDADARRRAEAVVDFWVENSMNPSGVPKTWYDIHKDRPVTWRDYPTHLRIAADGMMGVLDAWRLEKRSEWLAYARRFGDFLVAKQAADGSLAGLWRWDGKVEKPFTNATDHPIPFLVALYRTTGDERYKNAAIRAGEFCLPTIDAAYRYVGGAADNPNVTDKEAGVLAMQAFLALYDLTRDRRWIGPAARAATFCETWTYAWNVPIPAGDPGVVFSWSRTTLGVSLIATGHSGADDFMAITPYDYVRLYLLTGNSHFMRFARFVAQSTKQLVDWDGTLGYRYPGLLMEALNLQPLRGHGVKGWLPWLTVAVLEPMARMRDAFGTDDPAKVARIPGEPALRRAFPDR